LCIHHNEFFEYHKKKQKQLKKRVNQAKNSYELNNKKKEDVEDKATVARLKALKQHDMD
jgi:predicted Holliday junction resolvase-like endonuclease